MKQQRFSGEQIIFRALSIVDAYSRRVSFGQNLALEVDTSLPDERIVRVLERLREWRGLPQIIKVDGCPLGRSLESTRPRLDADALWA